jgi:hypothetical protein
MRKLYFLFIFLGLLLVLTGCQKTPNQGETEPPAQNTFRGQNGWEPTEACAHLSDTFKPGQYNNEGGIYTCYSTTKEIGSGGNKILYYARGDAQRARQVGLVLYVNSPQNATEAHDTLLEYSRQLSEKALDVPLSKAAANAIVSGTKGRGKVDTTRIEIFRYDSADGKGYELHYVITPQL